MRARKEADGAWFDDLMARYMTVFNAAEAALDACDWKAVGELADANHVLCQARHVAFLPATWPHTHKRTPAPRRHQQHKHHPQQQQQQCGGGGGSGTWHVARVA